MAKKPPKVVTTVQWYKARIKELETELKTSQAQRRWAGRLIYKMRRQFMWLGERALKAERFR